MIRLKHCRRKWMIVSGLPGTVSSESALAEESENISVIDHRKRARDADVARFNDLTVADNDGGGKRRERHDGQRCSSHTVPICLLELCPNAQC
jgi:hypothetical protein